MKRLLLFLAVITVSGCDRMQPEREIVSAFRAFVQAVERADMEKAEAIAPFLSGLSADQRETVIRSLRALASQTLEMTVTRGSGGTYLLNVSRAGPQGGVTPVPFRRNARGRWEMSPILESTRHFDLVPARK